MKKVDLKLTLPEDIADQAQSEGLLDARAVQELIRRELTRRARRSRGTSRTALVGDGSRRTGRSKHTGALTVNDPWSSEDALPEIHDLDALADEQGVEPRPHFDDLLGDFWPEDEAADDFLAAVKEWHREDTSGHRS